MAAQEEIGTETLELNPLVVRFVWRHAAYPTGWSTSGSNCCSMIL
jgi:hypothetical protein